VANPSDAELVELVVPADPDEADAVVTLRRVLEGFSAQSRTPSA
jgi:hypothetical protein